MTRIYRTFWMCRSRKMTWLMDRKVLRCNKSCRAVDCESCFLSLKCFTNRLFMSPLAPSRHSVGPSRCLSMGMLCCSALPGPLLQNAAGNKLGLAHQMISSFSDFQTKIVWIGCQYLPLYSNKQTFVKSTVCFTPIISKQLDKYKQEWN